MYRIADDEKVNQEKEEKEKKEKETTTTTTRKRKRRRWKSTIRKVKEKKFINVTSKDVQNNRKTRTRSRTRGRVGWKGNKVE